MNSDTLHHIRCFEARIEADLAKGGRCEKLKEKAPMGSCRWLSYENHGKILETSADVPWKLWKHILKYLKWCPLTSCERPSIFRQSNVLSARNSLVAITSTFASRFVAIKPTMKDVLITDLTTCLKQPQILIPLPGSGLSWLQDSSMNSCWSCCTLLKTNQFSQPSRGLHCVDVAKYIQVPISLLKAQVPNTGIIANVLLNPCKYCYWLQTVVCYAPKNWYSEWLRVYDSII